MRATPTPLHSAPIVLYDAPADNAETCPSPGTFPCPGANASAAARAACTLACAAHARAEVLTLSLADPATVTLEVSIAQGVGDYDMWVLFGTGDVSAAAGGAAVDWMFESGTTDALSVEMYDAAMAVYAEIGAAGDVQAKTPTVAEVKTMMAVNDAFQSDNPAISSDCGWKRATYFVGNSHAATAAANAGEATAAARYAQRTLAWATKNAQPNGDWDACGYPSTLKAPAAANLENCGSSYLDFKVWDSL